MLEPFRRLAPAPPAALIANAEVYTRREAEVRRRDASAPDGHAMRPRKTAGAAVPRIMLQSGI